MEEYYATDRVVCCEQPLQHYLLLFTYPVRYDAIVTTYKVP
jgi:hypothetical protein